MSILCPTDKEYEDAALNTDLLGPPASVVAKPLLSYATAYDSEGRNPSTSANAGMLTETTLDTIINNITDEKTNPKIPTIPEKATRKDKDDFDIKQKKLKDDIKAEYEFYYCRYIYCLNKLFRSISTTVPSNGNIDTTTIEKYLKLTKDYNIKLNDLIRIIHKLNTKISYNNTEAGLLLKGQDTQIEQLMKSLKEHNDKLSGKNTVTNLRKDMVKYTEEKGRYTDNLLKMYSVLNIVALGLLVYVYKSAS